MARTNKRAAPHVIPVPHTHGGGTAARIGTLAALRRSVLATMLNENSFYEGSDSILDRIKRLALECDPYSVSRLAIEAREEHGLRHAPLLLIVALTRTASGSSLVSDTISRVIKRPDEVGELIALYWGDGGRRPLSSQLKKGLAKVLSSFDTYQLSKYANMSAQVTLRDALFLTHAKPQQGMEGVFSQIASGSLKNTDTWESALSAGQDKRETFERLLREGRLGYLALLRNLHNMHMANVDEGLIIKAISERRGARGVLPFQFVSAAERAPRFANHIETALLASLEQMPRLGGKTVIVVDVSGSMKASLSSHSRRSLLDAAAILAGCMVKMCEDPVVYATAGSDYDGRHDTQLAQPAPGMAMVRVMEDALSKQGYGGIFLRQCIEHIQEREKSADRIVVLTDEQDCDRFGKGSALEAKPFGKHNYLINVASYEHGIGYHNWVHIDGFSEAVLKWIPQFEAEEGLKEADEAA